MRISLVDADEIIICRANSERFVTRFKRQIQIGLIDPWLSKKHAAVYKSDAGWVLRDKNSKNGTRINGQSVAQHRLGDGDVVHVGATVCVFRDGHVNHAICNNDRTKQLTGNPLATLNHDLQNTFAQIKTLAKTPITILLQGETGTGKEVTAQEIHTLSQRKGRFIAVNCGAIPEGIFESELFGCHRGAYSGAMESRIGRIRAAHQGTLFLDEIADLSPRSQVKLLRALQEKQVVPVGSYRPSAVDVRIIAATNRNLERLVETQAFRTDLYARLAGAVFTLPPLRERREDMGLIIASILSSLSGQRAVGTRFTHHVTLSLASYSWPRNIRELYNAVACALATCPGKTVDVCHLPASLRHPYHPLQSSTHVKETDQQRQYRILDLLRTHRGNVSAVARSLGVARVQVRRWCSRYEIDVNGFRDSG